MFFPDVRVLNASQFPKPFFSPRPHHCPLAEMVMESQQRPVKCQLIAPAGPLRAAGGKQARWVRLYSVPLRAGYQRAAFLAS